jgi:hypothetical protein
MEIPSDLAIENDGEYCMSKREYVFRRGVHNVYNISSIVQDRYYKGLGNAWHR